MKTAGSFLIILLLMPLGHALMGIMEHTLAPEPLHYTAFAMGFVGLVLAITGIFVKGDTKQTLFGIIGAMLFWTGWVEFLFLYYAQRFGTHCDLLGTGIVQTTSTYVDGICTQHDFLINGKPLCRLFGLDQLCAVSGIQLFQAFEVDIFYCVLAEAGDLSHLFKGISAKRQQNNLG